MPAEEAEQLAAPLLANLCQLAVPLHRDPARNPYRGSDAFRELQSGRPLP